MRKHPSSMMAVLAILMLILAACNGGGESPTEAAESEPDERATRRADGERRPDRARGLR